jgi:hypothetical protein
MLPDESRRKPRSITAWPGVAAMTTPSATPPAASFVESPLIANFQVVNQEVFQLQIVCHTDEPHADEGFIDPPGRFSVRGTLRF